MGMVEVVLPSWYTKVQALELALEHVRCYSDRMYIQFLIEVEKRNGRNNNRVDSICPTERSGITLCSSGESARSE